MLNPVRTPLRLVFLLLKTPQMRLCCDVICVTSRADYAELWLKCDNIDGLLSTLRVLATSAVVLATGGVDGSVYRPLPGSLEVLVDSASRALMLNPGVAVVVLPCDGNLIRAVKALTPYSARISVKRGSSMVKALISKPLSVEHLFDAGVRILKPVATPPRLLPSGPRRTTQSK